jgi:hypothetical protein
MAPWTPSNGYFDYYVSANGRIYDEKLEQYKWPTLHDTVAASIGPPGTRLEVLAEYVTPTQSYGNVPNLYIVPDLSTVGIFICPTPPSVFL